MISFYRYSFTPTTHRSLKMIWKGRRNEHEGDKREKMNSAQVMKMRADNMCLKY